MKEKIEIIDKSEYGKEASPFQKFLKSLYIYIVITVATYLTFSFVIMNSPVVSGSMETELMTGSIVVSNRLAKKYERNDIIVFESDEFDLPLVKRIIGIGGDIVELKDGLVYVNGEVEEVVKGQETYPLIDYPEREVYLVPEDSFLVLGDNRSFSIDSRGFKQPFIHKEQVLAKAFMKYSLWSDNNKVYVKFVK